MNVAQLARNIIKEFPHTSKKELGKLLFERHPLIFNSAEHGRLVIRGVTGAHGNKRLIQSKDYKGPLTIPKGELNDYSHYKVVGSNIGILCDIHLPYHDFDALDIAIHELKDKKIDTLILNGDIIDCYQASDFVRDPTKEGLKYEIEVLCLFLSNLKKFFPGIKIIYKLGNHEERWERTIMKKCPAIWGFECFELPNLIKIEYLRLYNTPLTIEFVDNKRIIDIGHLSIIHGHEFGKAVFNPVNPARGFFMKAKTSVLGGHHHQSSEHIESDLNGKIIGAWSVGSLCDLHPEYLPINRWNHGGARVSVHSDGSFEVHNFKIINGRIA